MGMLVRDAFVWVSRFFLLSPTLPHLLMLCVTRCVGSICVCAPRLALPSIGGIAFLYIAMAFAADFVPSGVHQPSSGSRTPADDQNWNAVDLGGNTRVHWCLAAPTQGACGRDLCTNNWRSGAWQLLHTEINAMLMENPGIVGHVWVQVGSSRRWAKHYVDGKMRLFKAWDRDAPTMPMHLMWVRILPAVFDQASYDRAVDDGFRMYWLCEAHDGSKVMEDEAIAVLTAAHMSGHARCQYQHSYIHSTY